MKKKKRKRKKRQRAQHTHKKKKRKKKKERNRTWPFLSIKQPHFLSVVFFFHFGEKTFLWDWGENT